MEPRLGRAPCPRALKFASVVRKLAIQPMRNQTRSINPSLSARIGPGSLGMVASFLIACAGVVAGIVAAYLGERGAAADARQTPPAIELRDHAAFQQSQIASLEHTALREGELRPARARLDFPAATLERLAAPKMGRAPAAPKIIIIFDDMGLDETVFEDVMALPGPKTLSFLPYGRDTAELARRARKAGNTIMLHLPMEPIGSDDPGPQALTVDMSERKVEQTLAWNLSRLEGYVGVNNHMGSRFTADERRMRTVLSELNERGLFFLDSVTTNTSAAPQAAKTVGAELYARDVFIDADETEPFVVQQLKRLEDIARETGYAVAIAHPRPATLRAIGPWMTSAPARGFELAPVTALPQLDQKETIDLIASRS